MFKSIRKKIIEDRGILNKRTGSQKVLFIIVYIVFALYALSFILPFVWMMLSTFQDPFTFTQNIALRKPFAMNGKWTLSNYTYVFTQLKNGDTTFLDMIFNSVWLAFSGAFLGVFFTMTMAYCMSRYNFRARNLLYALIIFGMTVPIIGTTGSTMKIFNFLGLYNTPALHIITSMSFSGFGFLVWYGFFKNLAWSYAEAVFVDGGNDFTVYFSIMIPQAMPMAGMFFIMGFVSGLNAFENIMLFLPSYPTVALGMYLMSTTLLRTGLTTVYYAGLFVAMIPSIIMFALMADKIIKNVSIGGLKG